MANGGLLKVLGTIFLFLFLFILFFRPLEVSDNWWHLSVGRWIVVHHQIPVEDPFPFLNEKTPWLHTPWLGSVMIYEAFQMGGEQGLKFFRFFYFIIVVGIFFGYFFRKIPFLLLLLLTILLAYGLSTRHFIRPEMFNYVFVQVLLIWMMAFERFGHRRFLYLIPILGALWFNTHFGACIYGGVILGTFWLASVVKLARLKISGMLIEDVRDQRNKVVALGLACLGFVVFFMATPLGWEGMYYQFKIFFPGDARGFYDTLRAIPESSPAKIFVGYRAWFWGLCGLTVFFLAHQKIKSFSRIMLFGVALVMFLFMSRNSAFFAIVAAYIIADAYAGTSWAGRNDIFFWKKPWGAAIFVISMLAMTLQFWSAAAYKVHDGDRVQPAVLLSTEEPRLVHGVDFLMKNKISGRVFNTVMRTGGYLLWEGYPHLRPWQDSRNLEFKRYYEVQAVFRDPALFWPAFEKEYLFDIILVYMDKTSLKFLRYIDRAPNWQLVYVEGILLIYVKRGAFSLPEDVDAFQERLKAVKISRQDIDVLQQTRAYGARMSLKELIHPRPLSVTDGQTGMTLLSLGYDGAGFGKLVDGLRDDHWTQDKEILKALQYLRRKKPME